MTLVLGTPRPGSALSRRVVPETRAQAIDGEEKLLDLDCNEASPLPTVIPRSLGCLNANPDVFADEPLLGTEDVAWF